METMAYFHAVDRGWTEAFRWTMAPVLGRSPTLLAGFH